ncbi:MAG: hypothetical protein KIT43_04695 [Bauldia sp.]|nr:hypothetical protein [Bauldia sp.]MCW5718777.1 hypothetical protein [Bauldia sp.]
MRVPFLLAALALSTTTVLAQTPPANVAPDADAPATAVEIGPWRIQVSLIDGVTFDRCMMSRTTEAGIEARFTRSETGLGLDLSSPRWQLEDGARYEVTFAADQRQWEAEVTATATSVSVALTDDDFIEGLRLANRLEVRGAGATIVVPLDSSSAALARLESCYERNSATEVTNPFVAPTRAP